MSLHEQLHRYLDVWTTSVTWRGPVDRRRLPDMTCHGTTRAKDYLTRKDTMPVALGLVGVSNDVARVLDVVARILGLDRLGRWSDLWEVTGVMLSGGCGGEGAETSCSDKPP